MRQFPRFLLGPSLGDKLLAGASVAKIELCRWPGGEQTEVSYRLEGTLADGDRATIAALVREFARPLPSRDSAAGGEEGGASC